MVVVVALYLIKKIKNKLCHWYAVSATQVLDDLLSQNIILEDRENQGLKNVPVFKDVLERSVGSLRFDNAILSNWEHHPLANFMGYSKEFVESINKQRNSGVGDFDLLMKMTMVPLDYVDQNGELNLQKLPL